MSEYKPKFEIGSKFFAVNADSLLGSIKVEKLIVSKIIQISKENFRYIPLGNQRECRTSEMYIDLRIAKQRAQEELKSIFENNKKSIEEYSEEL